MIAISIVFLASIPWLVMVRCRTWGELPEARRRYFVWLVTSMESLAFCGLFLGLALLFVGLEGMHHNLEIVTNLTWVAGVLFGIWTSVTWAISYRRMRV